jgi:hypothetical protein
MERERKPKADVPMREEKVKGLQMPYDDLLESLFVKFPQRAPTNMTPGLFSALLTGHYSQFMIVHPVSKEPFIAYSAIKKLKPDAERVVKVLLHVGYVKHKETDALKAFKEHGSFDFWQPKKPSRRVTIKRALEDGRIFANAYKQEGKTFREQNPWAMALEALGLTETIKKCTDAVRREQLNQKVGSLAQDLKQYAKRFLMALTMANPNFYMSSHRVNTEMSTYPPLFPESKYAGLVAQCAVEATDMFLKNTRLLTPEKYLETYHQKPPSTPFDELVNAHWRLQVKLYSNKFDKSSTTPTR